MEFATLIVIFSFTATARGTAGFDCLKGEKEVEVIDLMNPSACNKRPRDFLPPENIDVQVLQTDPEVQIEAYTCSVKLSKRAYYCSYFDSISYGSETVEWLKSYDVPATRCRQAGKTGQLSFFDGFKQRTLTLDQSGWATETYWAKGSYTNGHCDYRTFYYQSK